MRLLGRLRRRLSQSAYSVRAKPRTAYEWVEAVSHALLTGQIRPRDVVKSILKTAGALVVVAIVLFPVYWVFLSSISSGAGSLYSVEGINLIPENPSLDPYRWVFGAFSIPSYGIVIDLFGYSVTATTPGFDMPVNCANFNGCSRFPTYFWNSVTVAIPALILAVFVIVPGAYALSRRNFIFKPKILYSYVLFTQMGGGLGIAVLIAIYALFVKAGLLNNKLALATYYAATAVPFNTWLLKTYMDSIPTAYEEAAIVDGAPVWRVVYEIILPLSKPGLAAVFVFTFLVAWREFVVAEILLGTENYTLPVGLFSLVGEYQIPWARFSAFALAFALPVMIAYLAVQRYIQEGLSFGGID